MSKERFRLVSYISVEPAFCLFTIVFVVVDSTFINLLLQKKCRFNRTSEPDLGTPCDDEALGIRFVSEINTQYRFFMYFLCGIFTMFAIAWSDTGRRRKPLILLPIVGLVFQSLVGCLYTYFWTWPARAAALSNIVVDIMFGGMPMMVMTGMTYICDVTDLKTRTMGLGLLSAARTFGDLVGFGSSGFILRSLGFFNTFLSCAVFSLMTLVLAVLLVKDVSVPVEKKTHFTRCFSCTRVVDSIKVVYKKSLGRNRIVVTTLFIINTLVFFTTQGESSVQYLFLRHKFHWEEREYSTYVIYRYIGIIFGNIFCSVVLSKVLNVHDGLIGVFAGLWDTIAAFGYLFASQNWHLYTIPIFDIFHGTAFTASYSFYTKYYTSDEFGRLQSFLCLLGLVIPVCIPAYNEIFQRTMEAFPSAYFILSIILDIIVVLLYCASYFFGRKFRNEKPPVKEQELKMLSN